MRLDAAGTKLRRIRFLSAAEPEGSPEPGVRRARDTVTGRTVMLKTGEPEAALHEARCLLTLPPGVGPRVLDFVGPADGHVTLALESIEGLTLARAARTMPPSLIPRLGQALCQCLAHVHRAGWIHADLSPTNVIVRRSRTDVRVNLIDFGYSIDRFAAPDEERRGGTLPYVAPELAQGWILDGRADLYSLGVVLRETFPSVRRDPHWATVIDRLAAPIPADRYPHAAAARDEISRVFGLPPHPDRWPRVGSGPLCGRDELLSRVLTQAHRRNARVLVQALPGGGLTRFLREVAVRSLESGRPVRIVDLPDLGPDSKAALDYLAASLESPDPVVCGVDDPSPGLRWVPGRAGERIRRLLTGAHWTRVDLPPVAEVDLEEMVIAGLGYRDPAADRLVRPLFERTEGNPRACAAGFESCVRRCGIEDGTHFRLEPDRLTAWLRRRDSARPEASPVPLPKRLAAPLRTCARAGFSFPAGIGKGLLARFHRATDLGELLDHGLLVKTDRSRLRFVTRALWTGAASRDRARWPEVDRWLHEHFVPDPDQFGDALTAAARARAQGDGVAEARCLGRAISRAADQRRFGEALKLLAYLATPPEHWTEESMLRQCRRLGQLLQPEWTEEQLMALAGTCLRTVDRTLGLALLDRAASSDDPRAAVSALLMLADYWVTRADRTNYDKCIGALRSSSKVPGAVSPGILNHFAAVRCVTEGKLAEAMRLAEQAMRDLHADVAHYRALNLQLLAALRFARAPATAIRLMQRSLAHPLDAEFRAQARYNLTFMYGQLGRLAASAACADQGLREGSGKVTLHRILGLRIQRAWSWAEMDQIERAHEEALYLLRLATVRGASRHLITIRLLLGHCLQHLGYEGQAIQVQYRNWSDEVTDASEVAYQSLRYLVDALLDAEAWDAVRSHVAELVRPETVDDPEAALVAVRAQALVAFAEGRGSEARALLMGRLPAARRLATRTDSARYVHQLAVTLLHTGPNGPSRSVARRSAALFHEESTILPSSGFGYYRTQALLGLSEALRHAGQTSKSEQALSKAIALARRVGCRGLLARGLERRTGLPDTGRDNVG